MTRFYSNASRDPIVRPGRLPSAIGVGVPPDVSRPIGIAYEARRMNAPAYYEMRSARLEAEIGQLRAGGKPQKEKAEGK